MDPVVDQTLRLALALLFVTTASHKLRDPAHFEAALAAYRVLPAGAVRPTARALGWVELAVACALLASGPGRALAPAPGAAGPLAALALLGLYSGGIAVNLVRGRRDIDCGCHGPARRRPLGTALVLRNALLAVGAALVLFPRSNREWTPLDAATVLLATAVGALLWTTAGRLTTTARPQAGSAST